MMNNYLQVDLRAAGKDIHLIGKFKVKNYTQPKKKFCETPTPISKVDKTDPPIDIQKGQPKLPNTESIICETVNLNTHLDSLNTIHISESPEKAKSIDSPKETQPDHHFLSLPPRKYNPPELIQQMQSEELRERALPHAT